MKSGADRSLLWRLVVVAMRRQTADVLPSLTVGVLFGDLLVIVVFVGKVGGGGFGSRVTVAAVEDGLDFLS